MFNKPRASKPRKPAPDCSPPADSWETKLAAWHRQADTILERHRRQQEEVRQEKLLRQSQQLARDIFTALHDFNIQPGATWNPKIEGRIHQILEEKKPQLKDGERVLLHAQADLLVRYLRGQIDPPVARHLASLYDLRYNKEHAHPLGYHGRGFAKAAGETLGDIAFLGLTSGIKNWKTIGTVLAVGLPVTIGLVMVEKNWPNYIAGVARYFEDKSAPATAASLRAGIKQTPVPNAVTEWYLPEDMGHKQHKYALYPPVNFPPQSASLVNRPVTAFKLDEHYNVVKTEILNPRAQVNIIGKREYVLIDKKADLSHVQGFKIYCVTDKDHLVVNLEDVDQDSPASVKACLRKLPHGSRSANTP